MNHSESIKKVYNDWGANYDSDAEHNIAIIKIHPVVIDLLKKEPIKDKGLGLGCGTGIMTIAASQFSKEITSIDYSEGMLKEAKKKKSLGAKIDYLQADLSQKLPFADRAFDFVISVLTLHHLENLELIYKEISRVLRPGGFFIFDEFITDNLTQEQIDNPFSVNYPDPLTDAKKEGVKVWNTRPIEEHKKLLEEAGLEIEKEIDVKCDETIKPYVVNYEFHKGRTIAKVILARKPNEKN